MKVFFRKIKVLPVLRLCMSCLLCMAFLSSCGGNGRRVFLTTGPGKDDVFLIEGEACRKEELMVYLTATQNQYESVYGTEIWNTSHDGVTLEENVKDTVLAKIAQIKTMYLLAKEKGVSLTENEESQVEQAADVYFSSLNEAEVTSMGVNLETIRKLYREYAMADKVYQVIIQDINPEISDDEARTITVEHILFKTYNTDGEGGRIPYSEASRKEAFQKAREVWALATDGEHDFEELAAQYSEDETLTYSFRKGEMDQVFEDAAFRLETGGISDVVETESGYHIIKCISTFNREETDANKEKIVEERREEAFGQEYDAFVATLTRQLNEDLWNQISLIHDEQVPTSDFFDIYEKYVTVTAEALEDAQPPKSSS